MPTIFKRYDRYPAATGTFAGWSADLSTSASIFPAAGVVAMSAPNHLPADPRLPYARPLSLFVPTMSKDNRIGAIRTSLARSRRISHLSNPCDRWLCVKELHNRLPLVKIPALLIHSRNDRGVPPENADENLKQLGSTQKEIFWVENSGHVICREPDRQLAFDAAATFISRVSR